MKILLPEDLGEITNIRVFHDNSGLLFLFLFCYENYEVSARQHSITETLDNSITRTLDNPSTR